MTISATTQGIKPGVCTSTNRPSAPFDGQVIYMTDVDQTAVWDGTAWTVLAPIAGGRNVIINGAMQVAQRGTSTASITAGGYYTADRWFTNIDNTIGTWTQSIENDAPTGSGFIKSLKMLVTTANSALDASDFLNVDQRLEGQNLQQFLKGTASAKQFSISFWVKSNVTGTYIAELRDVSNTRSVSASYTISASATWEKKTITFPADTTGAFANDNSGALRLGFGLAMGSTYASGTLATTWGTIVTANRYAGQTNVSATLNNYWQITGVQLEAGAVATPFEFEDAQVTLAKCQRYYQRIGGAIYTLPTQAAGAYSTTRIYAPFALLTSLRGAVTAIDYAGTLYLTDVVNAYAVTAITLDIGNQNRPTVTIDVASGLTQFRPYFLTTLASSSPYLGVSAEL